MEAVQSKTTFTQRKSNEVKKKKKTFLTCHADELGAGVGASYCVPCLAEIIPTVILFDISDGEILTGHSNPAMTLPAPGVVSFGVSIAAAA